ncbi:MULTISPECIES: carbon storage regulator CsrA [Bacillaceae]|uniref:carbon storage regulator CsrA n=1 Tax=Bacillales TaxID=1385 RepID=UPI001883A91A|nr:MULTISPECIES: carbon storage regulator CsrA [Bacillaceae]MBF0705138.1 carbon storage regulator CsrA [Pseudalkalibacillus hwajinpoensis]MDO6656371.1 carbon storage regulator CsrA [Anaerobacillus sp. 1_MG-2023]WLR57833.1 carbon storage regulator CsrA [Pseudalkalibacillus hwajinpoensis]
MLVLGRKKGESIVINDEIELKIISIEGDTVKLGVEAPKNIAIHRKEVYEAIQSENKLAAMQEFSLEDLKEFQKSNSSKGPKS